MQCNSIRITLPNGRTKDYPFFSFDYYAATNELEHKEENIIIALDDTAKSFIYETDELSDEIVNREYVSVVFIE